MTQNTYPDTDIAIIGMSCRLPGNNNSPEEFWEFLLNQGDGIKKVPTDRWDNQAYYDADRTKKGKMYIDRGGFIDNIDQFDPQFFGISPKEAPYLDPQHRWLLELTQEAIENAGLIASDLKGSDTAVYIGQFMRDYEQLQLDPRAQNLMTNHSVTGPSTTLTSNRISYLFNFTGPSVTLDTACSSSIVALDMACQALLNDDSRLAVAGGVNILLRPEVTMSICKASMLSEDGYCKSFDASANGYVRSEGAGIVLVKKLQDALEDGDNVLAVIKATSVNQDGQTIGITVPNGDSQKVLFAKSLERAQLQSDDIQYIEAHGTGTAVGDPIEVNALGDMVGKRDTEQAPCIVGSVKSNIGHTEATAGMAGLIKTVMAINEGTIPSNIHLNNVNPAIDVKALNIQLADQAYPWPDLANKPRTALINSFGFGGTNSNVIVQQAPNIDTPETSSSITHEGIYFLPLSGKTEQALKDNAVQYQTLLSTLDSNEYKTDLNNICYSASIKREHYAYRLVVNGQTLEELISTLTDYIASQPNLQYAHSKQTQPNQDLCFVFSGMGPQWANMGKQLFLNEPVFAAKLRECDQAIAVHTGWSVIDKLFDQSSEIDETNIAQPAIFSIQVSLAHLLQSRGIKPACIVGHSVGEVAAACVAGALSFEDAVSVIYHRSRLQHTTQGMGKMLAIGISETQLQPYLQAHGDKVSIAAINSEQSLTLSGDAQALQQIEQQIDGDGEFARFLNVDVPYHGPGMEPLKAPLIEALANITPQTPHTPLYSTVTGKLSTQNDWDAPYWADNVREPVLFKHAIEAIANTVTNSFLEVAPHPVLSKNISKTLQDNCTIVSTLKRDHDDRAMFHRTLSELHTTGIGVDWSQLVNMNSQFVRLPNYPWQHQGYWSEDEQTQQARLYNISKSGNLLDAVHPLLGNPVNATIALWNQQISLDEHAYLADHQIEDEVVYPGAGYIEMALAMVRDHEKRGSVCLENIVFNKALFLPSDQTLTLESTIDKTNQRFHINAMDPETQEWEPVSQGVICDITPPGPERSIDLSTLITHLPNQFTKSAFYQHCHQLGLCYQTQFQVVEQAWYSDDRQSSLVHVRLPDDINLEDYLLHPIALDGAFQSLFATVEHGYLPVNIGQLDYYKASPQSFYCYLTTDIKTDQHIIGSLVLFDEAGNIFTEVLDIELNALQQGSSHLNNSLLYDYQWQLEALPQAAINQDAKKWLLFTGENDSLSPLLNLLRDQDTVYTVSPASCYAQLDEHHFTINPEYKDDFQTLLKTIDKDLHGIIYHSDPLTSEASLDQCSSEVVFEQALQSTAALMYLSQAIEQQDWQGKLNLFVTTVGAQTLDDTVANPIPASLWGFTRVLASEHPELNVSLIDLPTERNEEIHHYLVDTLRHSHYEQESALRLSGRYVHRLLALDDERLRQQSAKPAMVSEDQCFYLNHTSQGTELQSMTRGQTLKESQVEIDIHYTSEVQADTFTCVGTVSAIGNAVSLELGQTVIARSKQAPASYLVIEQGQVTPLANSLSPIDAATIGNEFIIAWHCLTKFADLQRGQRILVQDAATPLGLAFIKVAQQKQADIYATANSKQSIDYLQAHTQLDSEHVFSCADFSFVRDIDLTLSDNVGLHVVVNNLSGQFINKTCDLMADNGCFIELNQQPVMLNETFSEQLFTKNIAYHALNFNLLTTQTLNANQGSFNHLLALFESKQLTALPYQEYPAQETHDWLQHSDDNSPKAVLNFRQKTVLALPEIKDNPIQANRSYLVTGGLGGLGLELLKWLVNHGATSVILLGRSKANDKAQGLIDQLTTDQIKIHARQADVSKQEDIQAIINEIQQTMPPLAGIIHAAGVLRDGVIGQQSIENLNTVFAPKIKGCWNLHRATLDMNLDFFVNFSSIAAVLGWSGQSNYAAANAFMDAYAHRQVAQGKSALSLNWGPWGDAGMAANLGDKDQQRMQDSGMYALTNEAGLEAMRTTLNHHVTQAGVFELDWSRIMSLYPNPAQKTVFANFYQGGAQDGESQFIELFNQADDEQKKVLLTEQIKTLVAQSLAIESVDSIETSHNLFEYGFDSLTAMDFKNKLQAVVQCKLSTTLVLKYPTIEAMTQHLIDNVLSAANEQSNDVSDIVMWQPDHPEDITTCAVTGELPFTPLVNYWIKQNMSKHLNVGFLLEIKEDKFDLDALEMSLSIMLEYHDACRIQVIEEGNSIQQRITPSVGKVSLTQYDFSDLSYADGAEKMRQHNDELHRSFEFKEGSPLYRFAYYKLNDTHPHRLFILFHHFVCDGYSIILFGQTLQSTYQHIYNKQAVSLPAKQTSLIDWNKRMYQFAHDEAAEQVEHWLETIENNQSSHLEVDPKAQQARTLEDRKEINTVFDTEQYQQLLELCQNQKFELVDIVNLAVLKAFSQYDEKDVILLETMILGRNTFDDIDASQLVGQISEIATFSFDLSQHTEPNNLYALLDTLHEQRINTPNNGVGLNALRYVNSDSSMTEKFPAGPISKVTMVFDPQSYGVEDEAWFSQAKEGVGELATPVLEKDLTPFFLRVTVRGEKFIINFSYYQNVFSSDIANSILDKFMLTLNNMLLKKVDMDNSPLESLDVINAH